MAATEQVGDAESYSDKENSEVCLLSITNVL